MALPEAESALNVHTNGEVVLNVGNSRTSLSDQKEDEEEEEKERINRSSTRDS